MSKLLKSVQNKIRMMRGDRASLRHDLEIHEVQKEVQLLTFWKSLKHGKGPSLVLSCNGKETLKFDCFGKGRGHYHVAPHFTFKIFFLERTARAQIDRSINEILFNGQKYLRMNPDHGTSKIRIDKKRLLECCDRAASHMMFILENTPELQVLLEEEQPPLTPTHE